MAPTKRQLTLALSVTVRPQQPLKHSTSTTLTHNLPVPRSPHSPRRLCPSLRPRLLPPDPLHRLRPNPRPPSPSRRSPRNSPHPQQPPNPQRPSPNLAHPANHRRSLPHLRNRASHPRRHASQSLGEFRLRAARAVDGVEACEGWGRDQGDSGCFSVLWVDEYEGHGLAFCR